jgi:hypothetical protein
VTREEGGEEGASPQGAANAAKSGGKGEGGPSDD